MRMETVTALGPAEARAFAERWLPAWTGNDPERLVAFYTDDVFYSDSPIPDGVRGRAALLAYFRKLLGRNPAWVWTHRGSIPLADGFLNEWHASIPAQAGHHAFFSVLLDLGYAERRSPSTAASPAWGCRAGRPRAAPHRVGI